MKQHRKGELRVFSVNDPEGAKSLASAIDQGHYEELDVFKNDRQTYIARVRIHQQEAVLKVPRERNRRPWQRFLSLFRRSEAARHHESIRQLMELGFNGPKPLLAAERRVAGMVVDAFLVYRFVGGDRADASHAERITPELIRLHQAGFLRRDPHAKNFLIDGEQVIFIDFRLKRPLVFAGIRLHRELAAFLRTSPEGINHVPHAIRKSLAFRVGALLDQWFTAFKHSRRRMRTRIKRENSGRAE